MCARAVTCAGAPARCLPCACRGTDTQLPFQCPSDFIFHVPLLDQNGLAYRMPGFLQQPQVGGLKPA